MLLDDEINCNIVALLAAWYSEHHAVPTCIRWKNTNSKPFSLGIGTLQGGILSPYMFMRYIRELIAAVVLTDIRSNIGGAFYTSLAYADDWYFWLLIAGKLYHV